MAFRFRWDETPEILLPIFPRNNCRHIFHKCLAQESTSEQKRPIARANKLLIHYANSCSATVLFRGQYACTHSCNRLAVHIEAPPTVAQLHTAQLLPPPPTPPPYRGGEFIFRSYPTEYGAGLSKDRLLTFPDFVVCRSDQQLLSHSSGSPGDTLWHLDRRARISERHQGWPAGGSFS